jgi:glycosyltransferase involved in cell wall biosynthesis
VGRSVPREEAKRRLGIDPAQVVALTLARGLKYAPAPWHPGFAEVVGPAIADEPSVTLLAVGPDPGDDAWARLVRAHPSRVVVPGPQRDPALYLDACDIYLDSFPFASITSMLEAATRGVPVLASRMHAGLARLMGSTGPIDDLVVGAGDPEAFRATLGSLARDPALRARLGRQVADRVAREHGAEAWLANVEATYEQAIAATPVRARDVAAADRGALEAYAEALLGIEARSPLLWTILVAREGFDIADKLSSWGRTSAVRAGQRARRTGALPGPAASTLLLP